MASSTRRHSQPGDFSKFSQGFHGVSIAGGSAYLWKDFVKAPASTI